jgi:hypothetical protein
MRIVKSLALAAVLAGSLAGLTGAASATPLASGSHPAAAMDSGLVMPVWHYGRPHYGRPHYGRPHYVRPYRRYYRPYYRPRVVCRTVYRTVRTPSGRLVTRPVRTCIR